MNLSSDSPKQSSIGSQIAHGVGWMMLLKFTVRSLGLISTLVLVRLLTPADFGIVAMAMVFIGLLEVLSWFSFDMVLIQHKDPTKEHYNTAWTFNLIFKGASAAILVLGALPIANYYQQPEVAWIIWILGAGVAIEGLANVGVVDFRKHMQFDKEFRYMVIPKVAAFLVTIPLAFYLRNFWALVAGMLVGRMVMVVTGYVLSNYRPRLSLSKRNELFHFSKWVFIANLCHAIRNKGTELVIGRWLGAPALGSFMVSIEVSNLPTTELVAPINRVVFPGYSKISHDMEQMRAGYLAVLGMIALVAVPAGIGIAATASLLVPIALGEQWLHTVPLIALLALFGVLVALQSNLSSLFLALGKPRVLAFLSGSHAILMLGIALPALHYYGLIGAAASYVISTLCIIPINYGVMMRTIDLSFGRLIACLYRPLLASLAMYIAVRAVLQQLPQESTTGSQLIQLFGLCALGALVYTAVCFFLWVLAGRPQGAEQYVLTKLRRAN